jgi:dihydroorotate dehydrogenase
LQHGYEAGGLASAPMQQASNRVITQPRCPLVDKVPIIGLGRVMRAENALAKRQADPELVQVYTGFIHKGAGLVTGAATASKIAPSRG